MLNQQYNTNTRLMNFRIPITLGDTFDKICQLKATSRTRILIDLINNYLKEETPKIKSQVEETNYIRNLFK